MVRVFNYSTNSISLPRTVTGLIKRAETVLKQNNTMNIEEIYFDKLSEDTGSAQSLTVKTLAKFKDFSKHRRPVSNISWKLAREPQVQSGDLSLVQIRKDTVL